MSEAHCLQRTLTCEHTIPDPGDAENVVVDRQFAVLEIVTATTESRTILNPTTAGIILTITLKTDGGDVAVYFQTAIDASSNTSALFDDAGDTVMVVSVSTSSAYRWQLLVNSGTTLSP